MSAAIEFQGVSKQYGAQRAVDSLTLSVPEGACLGLIGANGAGKTTAFSMVCGFVRPTAGEIRVFGAPVRAGDPVPGLGVLPQDAILPPRWAVGAYLSYLAELGGARDPRAEAERVLALVSLSQSWASHAGTLSHGMAKRVGIAQALLGSPRLVIFDEPTAGLDPRLAAETRALIRGFKGQATVVVSSHNLAELESLCDSAAILERGRLVGFGTMAELTGASASFQIAYRGGVAPIDRLRLLEGCRSANAVSATAVELSTAGNAESVDELLTRALALMIASRLTITGVQKGASLEKRVLELAGNPTTN